MKNAKVYLAAPSRYESKAVKVIAKLEDETGKVAIWLRLDLADLTSVKAATVEFLSKEERLNVLFCNA